MYKRNLSFIIFNCVCVFVHVNSGAWRSVGSTGAEVTGGGEPLDIGAGNRT